MKVMLVCLGLGCCQVLLDEGCRFVGQSLGRNTVEVETTQRWECSSCGHSNCDWTSICGKCGRSTRPR